MRYEVRETQTVEYVWTVDADSQEEAEETAEDGVPEDAESRLLSSGVTAKAVTEERSWQDQWWAEHDSGPVGGGGW